MKLEGKTDPKLLELLRRAKDHVMTPEEMFEQRVSFVYGQQDHDNPNPKSKDEIRQMLIKSQGYPPCPVCAARNDPPKQDRDYHDKS